MTLTGHELPLYSLTVEMCRSIEEVPGPTYDGLTRGRSFYVSRPWLLSIERMRDGTVRYLCCRDTAGTLLGMLPVYREAPGRYHLYNQFLGLFGETFRAADWSPAVVLGSQAAYCAEFAIAPDLGAEASADVLTALLSAAGQTVSGSAQPLAALYLNPQGRAQLVGAGVDEQDLFTVGGKCIIDISHSSFTSFAATLGRRRREIGRERRVFAAAGYETINGPLSQFIDTAADLCTKLQHKYGDHTSTIETRRRYLGTLAEAADAYSHVIVIQRDQQPVGIVICFIWGDTVYVRQAGFDYDQTGDSFEYFNLCIYAPIELAISRSLRKVDLGMSSYKAKLSRGARIEILTGYAASAERRNPNDSPVFDRWQAQRRELLERADGDELDQEPSL